MLFKNLARQTADSFSKTSEISLNPLSINVSEFFIVW